VVFSLPFFYNADDGMGAHCLYTSKQNKKKTKKEVELNFLNTNSGVLVKVAVP
jgi:hypothetical protein